MVTTLGIGQSASKVPKPVTLKAWYSHNDRTDVGPRDNGKSQ